MKHRTGLLAAPACAVAAAALLAAPALAATTFTVSPGGAWSPFPSDAFPELRRYRGPSPGSSRR